MHPMLHIIAEARRFMKITAVLALTGLVATVTARANAGEAECKVVVDALVLMTQQPVVGQRQVTTVEGTEILTEMVFTQEAMFVNSGGRWKQMDVTGALRHSQMKALLNSLPLQDCAEEGPREIDGVMTRLLVYRQPRLDQPSQIVEAKVWIGRDDGLPYRLEAETSVQTIDYKTTAPSP